MEEEDYVKLPVRDKCEHKLWKARLSGYEGAIELFNKLDEQSPEWNKYSGLIKTFVTDSNAAAQEKGVQAALAFVENCSSAGKTVGDVMIGLIQKCVNAPKAKTKELAIQLSLKYIELEKQDVVLEELIKGTENKNPKISASCIHIINTALQEFGANVINVNIVLKRMLLLLEDRDKNVRDEAKSCVVELYRWMGLSLEPNLNTLKPSQLADIKMEFEKQKYIEVKPKRSLKSQQVKKIQNENTCPPQDISSETDLVSCNTDIDPYELLDPVDILSNLSSNFYSQIEAKKWSERKEALESLEKLLLGAPKIEHSDYSVLVRVLRKIIENDTNIVVVGIAIKCITGLANGLKKQFNQYSSSIMPCLLEKFKEKKQNIVIALRDAVDAVYLTTGLEQILEDVTGFLENKNPNLKAEVASFLARCFHKTNPAVLNKKLLQPLTRALLISLRDQDQTVRDNAANALGVAMMVTGEKAIGPFLTELDNLKLAKIKECFEKAELEKMKHNTKPIAIKTKDHKKSTNEERPTISKTSVSKSLEFKNSIVETAVEQCDAIKLTAVIPQNIRSCLTSQGMDKIPAYKKLKEFIETQEKSKCLGVLMLLYNDDVKKNSDANVKFARIDVINKLVETINIPENMLDEIVLETGSYLYHKETADLATAILNKLTEKFTLNCIAKLLLSRDLEDQPTLWAETLRWISNIVVKERDCVNSKLLMEYGKKALSQPDILVRNAALALIGTVHLQAGDVELKHVEFPSGVEVNKDISSENYIKNLPRTVTRDKDKHIAEVPAECILESQITEQLISDLMDKNWKSRSEAVNKLHSIIKEAGPICPNLGEAPPVLAARLSDSNSKIAAASVALIESLAEGMGPHCKQHTSTFLPPLIKLVGDSKVWIRTAAVSCLKKWYDIGGYREFFEGEIIADALKSGSPSLRSEVWNFLAVRLPNIPARALPKEELMVCLPALFTNLEDRHSDVRKSACDALPGFMIHLGFNIMNSAYETTKSNGNSNIKLLLEKARGSIPENLPTPKNKTDTANSISSRTKKVLRTSSKNVKLTKEMNKSVNPRDKAETESDTAALLPTNNLKNQRIIDEQKLKTLKWNFTTPRTEYVDLLKEQMILANINKNLISNMFHNDFRYHLKAIDALSDNLSSNELIPLTCNLDLILRWMTLRFFDTNPSVLLKCLDYLNTAFDLLATSGYQLLDYEANSFVPYLILKFGDSKEVVRNSIRTLFKQISHMFPVSKLFTLIMERIKSKNSRQRSECLEYLGWIIESYGMSVCQPNVISAIREIASYISDRDTNVRNAALNCIVTAYFLEGEKITKMVGPIADKDKFLLEERIKRVSKSRPVVKVKPLNQIDETATSELMQPLQDPEHIAGESYPNVRLSEEIGESNSRVTEEKKLNSEHVSASLLNEEAEPTAPFSLDQQFFDDIEKDALTVIQPQVAEVDIEFLKEPIVKPSFKLTQATDVPSNLLHLTQKNALKRDITNISNSDIEKANESINQIDIVLNSDKGIQLKGFIDLIVGQVVHQLTNLKQNSLPEVVTCYKAIFSLLMKLLNYPDLYMEISENSVHKIVHQLIVLMVERRLQGYDRHEMFVRTINILIMKCIDQLDKTNVLCALINLLHDMLSDSSVPPLYKDLVTKCLWKLNRAQSIWDSQLDYKRVLLQINIFFRDYPSSWWKMQESDVTSRTVKTILFTMVKIRGVQVQEIAKNLPEISQSGELYLYIKKLARHLKVTNTVQSSPTEQSTSARKIELNSSCKLTKDIQVELDELFKIMGKGDSKEISDGIKKLCALTKAHPGININPFLSTVSPSLKKCIEKGIAEFDQPVQHISKLSKKKSTSAGITLKYSSPKECDTGSKGSNDDVSHENSNYFKGEAQRLWTRLQYLKEQAGLPVDTRSLEDLCDNKKPEAESALCNTEVVSDFD